MSSDSNSVLGKRKGVEENDAESNNIARKAYFEEKFRLRREALALSLRADFNYCGSASICHVQQSYSEKSAVCAMLAFGHVLGVVISRAEFDKYGKDLTLLNPPKENEVYYNTNGHYHQDVLHYALQANGYSVEKVGYDGNSVETNTEERSSRFIEAIRSSPSDCFILKAKIILKEPHLKLAPKHYVAIRKIPDTDETVLLDRNFDCPKILCREVLCRCTQLCKLYAVSKKSEVNFVCL